YAASARRRCTSSPAARKRAITRSFISAAAFSVKVTARISSGETPSATSERNRSTSTVVFPDPAPAERAISGCRPTTASRCPGVTRGWGEASTGGATTFPMRIGSPVLVSGMDLLRLPGLVPLVPADGPELAEAALPVPRPDDHLHAGQPVHQRGDAPRGVAAEELVPLLPLHGPDGLPLQAEPRHPVGEVG